MQLDLALGVKIVYLTVAFSREIMLEKEQKSLLNNVTKTTTVTNTGDAVGVSDGRFWCVGIVTCRNEKKVAERVDKPVMRCISHCVPKCISGVRHYG